MIKAELNQYFAGERKEFTVPIHMDAGTDFQQKTWQALQHISYGQTISYKQLATNIGNLQACRAVANANGANRFVIIFPCHRVVSADGSLGVYSAGIERKKWLLEHEKKWTL